MPLFSTRNGGLHSALVPARITIRSDKTLSRPERIFWVVSFIIACGFAANFIMNVYEKWTNSPVIMSLAPDSTNLSSIPFPAITICNMNNVRKSVAMSILESNNVSGSEGSQERKMLNDICKRAQDPKDSNIDVAEIDWQTLLSFMIRVSQPCHEMLVSCSWHGEQHNCGDLFNTALTDEGICCSFNKIKREFLFHNPKDLSGLNFTFPYDSVDWTPERGYPPKAPAESLPWRAWGAGSHLGLTIVLDAELQEYFCSSEISRGFKVMLHNSVETPKMSEFSSLLPPGVESRMTVEPQIMKATDQFHRIPYYKRNCVFASERNLSFYRTYTQRNCALECEAKFTLEACNCVLYYMPKNFSTRICDRSDENCALRALKAMELRLIDDGNISASLNTTKTKPCGCRPGCFAISYTKVETTSSLSAADEIPQQYLGSRDTAYFSKSMTVVHVFFTNTQYTATLRGELFGITELLSNTGGLLGLFMGFSFLSAVEAIYFLTLRLWCTNCRKRDKTSPIAGKLIKGKTPFPFTQ